MSGARRAVACLAGVAALAGAAAAQDTAAVRTARITYLTGASVYLDAGRLEGLREGARVEVTRGGTVIGVLQVVYLASHRSSCSVVSTSAPPVVGDVVRFAPAAPPPDSALASQTPDARPRPQTARSRPGLRGRVGVDYFALSQRGAASGGLAEPGLQLRLNGPPAGVSALNLTVDVRARRTHTTLPDGTADSEGRSRVYQAALALNAPGSPARLTVGRQISGNLSPVGLFDGLLAELHHPQWSSGVFAGSQPEPLELGWSGSVVEFGAYVQRHSRPGAPARWALTAGASVSYQDAHANREFAFLQATLNARRLSAFVTQEIDYYRPWKQLPGMRTISPTSTFALVRYRATGLVTLEAGFDNRHNVRLYRDVTNPATEFDDTYRQGAWGGVWLELGRRARVGLDARSSSGGPAGRADAFTFSLAADRLTALGLSLRTRSTRYTNPMLSGWLHAATLSVQLDSRLHVELNGGIRVERDPMADPSDLTASWVGADLDVTLARAWYLMVSASQQRGGLDGYDQIFGGLSFRF